MSDFVGEPWTLPSYSSPPGNHTAGSGQVLQHTRMNTGWVSIGTPLRTPQSSDVSVGSWQTTPPGLANEGSLQPAMVGAVHNLGGIIATASVGAVHNQLRGSASYQQAVQDPEAAAPEAIPEAAAPMAAAAPEAVQRWTHPAPVQAQVQQELQFVRRFHGATPAPIVAWAQDDIDAFKAALQHFGLYTQATDYFEAGQCTMRRPQVRQLMENLYAGCDQATWDIASVTPNLNVQIALATQAYMNIVNKTKMHYKPMLDLLCYNAKMVTLWQQECRNDTGGLKKQYLAHWYPYQQNPEFVYDTDQQWFNKWIRDNPPAVLQPFRNGLNGVWLPLFSAGLLKTLVIKVPIVEDFEKWTDGQVHRFLRKSCAQTPSLLHALNACCDSMVSDLDGLQDGLAFKYKAIYIKLNIIKAPAIEVFKACIPLMSTLCSNGVSLQWQFEIQSNNAVAKPKREPARALVQRVMYDQVEITAFPEQDGDVVAASLESMSLADGNAIAYGGAVVAFGDQPAFVSSHTEHDFFQLLFSWAYPAEVGQMQTSPFWVSFGKMYFENSLELAKIKLTTGLAAKSVHDLMPGITLMQTNNNCNLQDQMGQGIGQLFAKFAAGSFVITNAVPIRFRMDWHEQFHINEDGGPLTASHTEHGETTERTWPSSTWANIGFVFRVGANGVEFVSFGFMLQQHLSPIFGAPLAQLYECWVPLLSKWIGAQATQAFQHRALVANASASSSGPQPSMAMSWQDNSIGQLQLTGPLVHHCPLVRATNIGIGSIPQ